MRAVKHKQFSIPASKVLKALKRVGYHIPDGASITAEITIDKKLTRVSSGDFESVVLFWSDYEDVGGPPDEQN